MERQLEVIPVMDVAIMADSGDKKGGCYVGLLS